MCIGGLQFEPRVASNTASIISELAESTLNIGYILHTSIFSECFEELIDCLYDLSIRQVSCDSESTRLKVSGFSALYNLLQYAPRDCARSSEAFMHRMIEALEFSLKTKLNVHYQELQGFLLCTLQCILTNLEDEISNDVAKKILNLVIGIFNQRGDVFDEGFLVMSALCNKFIHSMRDNVNTCAPYIIHGIKSKNAAIIRNSCGLLSDFCTLVESEELLEGSEQYVPILLDYLRDPTLDRNAKIVIITVIGDTFLYTKDRYGKFIEETLSILEGACNLVIKGNFALYFY